jgi:hypothetical protein
MEVHGARSHLEIHHNKNLLYYLPKEDVVYWFIAKKLKQEHIK